MERIAQSADGRTLAVREAGDPDGRPVLVHMGTPNSRLLYGRNVADAGRPWPAADQLRPARLRRLDAQPGRSVADCAARRACDLRSTGHRPAGMWGISGGGPHVLACAALLPDLVVAAASLASPAPYGADGLDWFAGMGQENVDDVRLMFSDEDAARQKLAKDRAEIPRRHPG